MTIPFAIHGIDHVVLRAHDVAKLVAFYQIVLGCPIERVLGDLTQLRAGQSLIDIVPRGDDEGYGDGRNMDRLCLTLDPFDADQIAAWLTASRVLTGEITMRYVANGYGRSIYLTDPEGNDLEICAAGR